MITSTSRLRVHFMAMGINRTYLSVIERSGGTAAAALLSTIYSRQQAENSALQPAASELPALQPAASESPEVVKVRAAAARMPQSTHS
jgi:hypothetical protein